MMYDWKQNCDRAASVKIFERVFPVKARTIEEQIYKEAISYEDYQSKVITAQQKFKHQIQEVLGKLVNQLSYFKKLEEQLLNHDFKEEANYWKKIITFLQNRDKQNVDLVQAQKIQVTIEKSLQEVRQKLKAAAASQVSNANSRPVPQAAIGQVTAIAQSSPNVEPSPSQETDPYSHLFQLLGTTSRNRTINNTLHRTFASAVELLDMEKLLPSNDNDPTKFSDLDEHVYISLDPRIPTVSHVVQYEIIHAKHECNTKLLSPSWEIWPCSLLLQRANCDCPSLEVSISLDYPSDSPKYSLVNKDDDYILRFEKKLGMLELPFTLTDLIRLTAHCCLCKRDL